MVFKFNQSCFTAILAFLCTLLSSQLMAQTIAEKRANLSSGGEDLPAGTQQLLFEINRDLLEEQKKLQELNQRALNLYAEEAPEEEFKQLLIETEQIKKTIRELEESWRRAATSEEGGEGYALWYQPETTIGQLVIDYGSQQYVYLISPEIAGIKISINSSLPIPRSSWEEMLELILNQNGVGIRQLNPYLRQLYLIKQDRSSVTLISNRRQDLDILPSDTRLAFVLSPEPSDVRRVWFFMDKFVNPNTTILQMIGRDLLIVGRTGDIQDLLHLYDFIVNNRGDKEYKVVRLRRVDAEEMSKVLAAIFDQLMEKPKSVERPSIAGKPIPAVSAAALADKLRVEASPDMGDGNGLKIVPLTHITQGLFLVGTKEEIRKAEAIIEEVESQVGDAREKVIYWYTAKHSQAEELADVLSKVYALMVETGVGRATTAVAMGAEMIANVIQKDAEAIANEFPPLPNTLYPPGAYLPGRQIVAPRRVMPGAVGKIEVSDRPNFIVDAKTGSIVMVIEADLLPKMKELVKRLDVPKKMVNIEVLLFEQNIQEQTNYGLNLLRIGDSASNTHQTSADFNNVNPVGSTTLAPENAGIFQFLMSRMKTCAGFPAYDLIYRFLISRDDIQINASPSVVTVNQTPAQIAILEEVSINTGVFEVETAKGVTLKDAFDRAQYGITINVTPTIHPREEEAIDSVEYITLDTDITFDTISPRLGVLVDRPDVITRHVTNQVRIPDGQTVIIGGLRRKISQDSKQSIPFLGELPGLGKLFSQTSLVDRSSEMFLFITPKIISDPVEDFYTMRAQEMCRRPGDIPAFLCHLNAAREYERRQALQGTLRILLDRELGRCVDTEGPYSEWPIPCCP